MHKINKLLDLRQISNTFFLSIQNKIISTKTEDKILPGCCRLSDYVASSFLRPTDFRKCNQPLKSEGNSFYTLGGSVGLQLRRAPSATWWPDWATGLGCGLRRRQWCRRAVCQQNPKISSCNSIQEFARFFYIFFFFFNVLMIYCIGSISFYMKRSYK